MTEFNKKSNRVYLALRIVIDNNDYIPFESKLHNHPALTNTSQIILPYNSNSIHYPNAGINFEKTLIINDEEYIIRNGSIARSQLNTIVSKRKFIMRMFTKYIKEYKEIIRKDSGPIPFRCKYTTLKYYHTELGI